MGSENRPLNENHNVLGHCEELWVVYNSRRQAKILLEQKSAAPQRAPRSTLSVNCMTKPSARFPRAVYGYDPHRHLPPDQSHALA